MDSGLGCRACWLAGCPGAMPTSACFSPGVRCRHFLELQPRLPRVHGRRLSVVQKSMASSSPTFQSWWETWRQRSSCATQVRCALRCTHRAGCYGWWWWWWWRWWLWLLVRPGGWVWRSAHGLLPSTGCCWPASYPSLLRLLRPACPPACPPARLPVCSPACLPACSGGERVLCGAAA